MSLDNQKFFIAQGLVSAIVLSYNRKEDTLKCLESLNKQSYPNIEIVILDNGSKDGSADAIAESFPKYTLIRMPKNYGDWEGRDIGLRNCHGNYIVCIDNDAILNPTVIKTMINYMQEDNCLAVIEPAVVDPDSGQTYSCPPNISKLNHYRANFLGGASMYRREALMKVSGFPHYLLGGAETHLSLRFLDLGYRILHIGDCEIYHKMSNIERIPHTRFYLQTKQRLRAFMSHYPRFGRAILDLNWKIIFYLYKGIKCGFWKYMSIDILKLYYWGIKSLIEGTWRVKIETINLYDYLHLNIVRNLEEYNSIDVSKNMLIERFMERIK